MPDVKPAQHRLTMALTKGDILVFVTEAHDEQHRPREFVYPLRLFYVENIEYEPHFHYTLINKAGTKFTGDHRNPLQLHLHLSIQPVFPLEVVRKPRGFCSLFIVEITHGYRLHYLDFVKNRLPEIYQQLNLS